MLVLVLVVKKYYVLGITYYVVRIVYEDIVVRQPVVYVEFNS